jgi:hypothetical protein
MKVTVKRNLIIFHRPEEWEAIHQQLIHEHGPSIAISWKLKRELGFTVRRHKGLVPRKPSDLTSELDHRYYYEDQVHLDFFNEATQSWFQLKYLNL